jgi:hypothetical protein
VDIIVLKKAFDVGIFRFVKCFDVGLLGSKTFGNFLKFLSASLATFFCQGPGHTAYL